MEASKKSHNPIGNMPHVNDFLGVLTSNFVINSLLVNVANQLKNEVKNF